MATRHIRDCLTRLIVSYALLVMMQVRYLSLTIAKFMSRIESARPGMPDVRQLSHSANRGCGLRVRETCLASEEAAGAELEDDINDVIQRGADAGGLLPVQRAHRRRRQVDLRHGRSFADWRFTRHLLTSDTHMPYIVPPLRKNIILLLFCACSRCTVAWRARASSARILYLLKAARAPRQRTLEAVRSACWAEELATACRLRAGSLAVRDGVKSRCPPSPPPAAAPLAACFQREHGEAPAVDLDQLAADYASLS